MYQNLS